jgi:hypothetical protein
VSHGLLGILVLNLCFALAGFALLWALRGFDSWLDLLELGGVALLIGLAMVSLLATFVLVAGGGLSSPVVLGLIAVPLALGIALARARGRRLPRTLGGLPRLTVGTAAALLAAGLTLAMLVALFRVARVTPLEGADSWEFWVPKAKVIYFKGGIDNAVFPTLANGSYPLLVPALLALDFRFMGSAFAPELAVQYWLLYAGFVLAVAALLRRAVPVWLAWLFISFSSVVPMLDQRVIDAQADWILDILFALSALLCLGWLRSREPWQLVSFALADAALVAAKREGLLLAVCLAAGALAGSRRDLRRSWPPLVAVTALAYLVEIPWQLWWHARHLTSDVPLGGFAVGTLLTHLSRVWPSLDHVLALQFSTAMWLLALPITLVASAACLTLAPPARDDAVLFLTTCLAAIAGFTWIGWSDPEAIVSGAQDPIPRVVGSLALCAVVLAPLMIAPLLAVARR